LYISISCCCLQGLTLALSCLSFRNHNMTLDTHSMALSILLCCCLQGLTLALSCLSFDFVGTCLDDSAEDMSTIQVGIATSNSNCLHTTCENLLTYNPRSSSTHHRAISVTTAQKT
jgi:hypothetical protein